MLGGLGFPEILTILFWIVVFGFIALMFFHMIANKLLPVVWKIVWIFAFFIFHIFAAVAYYFYYYRIDPQSKKLIPGLKSQKS
jgi:hypothetical protein